MVLRRVAVAGHGVVSSGLTSPKFHDWLGEIPSVAASRPTGVIVVMGMNDVMFSMPKGYGALARRFLEPIKAAGIPFAWLAVPHTDDGARNRRIDAINSIIRDVVVSYGGDFPAAPNVPRSERRPDGIHFTPKGYLALASAAVRRNSPSPLDADETPPVIEVSGASSSAP
jgi:hypothetical protein